MKERNKNVISSIQDQNISELSLIRQYHVAYIPISLISSNIFCQDNHVSVSYSNWPSCDGPNGLDNKFPLLLCPDETTHSTHHLQSQESLEIYPNG